MRHELQNEPSSSDPIRGGVQGPREEVSAAGADCGRGLVPLPHARLPGMVLRQRGNIFQYRGKRTPLVSKKNCKLSLSEPHKNTAQALHTFNNKASKKPMYKKQELTPEAKGILASYLHLEYDLYNFVLGRLDQELKSIQMAGR